MYLRLYTWRQVRGVNTFFHKTSQRRFNQTNEVFVVYKCYKVKQVQVRYANECAIVVGIEP
jgi:hypothetical protein